MCSRGGAGERDNPAPLSVCRREQPGEPPVASPAVPGLQLTKSGIAVCITGDDHLAASAVILGLSLERDHLEAVFPVPRSWEIVDVGTRGEIQPPCFRQHDILRYAVLLENIAQAYRDSIFLRVGTAELRYGQYKVLAVASDGVHHRVEDLGTIEYSAGDFRGEPDVLIEL